MRSDGQSIGGSYIFDGGFVGVAVSRIASFYRVPGLESTETNTRIDMNQTKVASRGEYRPQAYGIEAIRFWFGHTDYKHNELANEGGFDGIQQTFTNKEQEGRVEVQLLPFDLRFAHADDRARRAGHAPAAERAGRRRRPVRSQPHHQRRRLHVQRVPLQRDASGCRSPAASSRRT